MTVSSNVIITLPPDEPGLDQETRERRVALAKLQQMSLEEARALAVRAGILKEDGTLADIYSEPSVYRPTL